MLIENGDRLGGTSARGALGAVLATMACCVGCASPGPRGELPFGEWAGHGTVVYEAWGQSEGDDQDAKSHSVQRRYATTLSIRPGRIGDREIIEVEILAQRGKLAEDDKDARSHLKLALVKAKRVSDSTVLYRVVGFLYNPDPEAKLPYNEQAPPYGAVCSEQWGAKVFEVLYMENFFDTIRFRGNRAEKSGVYFDERSGIIHWAERLTRGR